ncbi:LacI family DNA-binding transcriptional regulator [Deminuibacter soli]|uniref:LacI family transcriptional regulator n=1 Tax=Deminuibacter soli TaxID=2291815 RepID=A0A3E1NHX5_9BACT|nr:LacI family DNA-binding transcriptional regulator [Deminuibacter soli]RFM27545.1 LacI family transcriptional regulator [Deminuibacter soli]
MTNVNLKHLAKELNLAVSTVSRALRDSYDIGEETKRKVMALAKKLNYEPNPYASSLRKQKSRTIAVIIPEIANNFFSLAINGIEEIAQEKGYHVLIYITHEDYNKELSIMRYLQNGRVDGVLMSVSSNTDDIEHIINLKQRNVPIVFFDRICENVETAKITTDDYESGFKATEHLIQQGCTNIAYLCISKHLSIGNKRMHGYLDAIKKYKLRSPQTNIVFGSNNHEENYNKVKKLLSAKNRPDGIFASVEKLALTAYHAAHELDIHIPKQLKIISFANLETAPLLKPSLTTITQPAFEIGKRAAMTLFRSLDKKNAPIINETIILNATLIPRESTRK